jgi:Rieske Fe-S protein
MLKENATAVPRLGANLTPGQVRNRDDIAPGCAAVIRHGLKKTAVYRDEDGGFHEVSAICTHLGCVVEWNGLEKSWDCPCHGSRFDIEGSVLNGPATRPLA